MDTKENSLISYDGKLYRLEQSKFRMRLCGSECVLYKTHVEMGNQSRRSDTSFSKTVLGKLLEKTCVKSTNLIFKKVKENKE